jgi:hypothetical protein
MGDTYRVPTKDSLGPCQHIVELLQRRHRQPTSDIWIGGETVEQQLGVQRRLGNQLGNDPVALHLVATHNEWPHLDTVRPEWLHPEDVVVVILLEWGMQVTIPGDVCRWGLVIV